ncbi:hypothetical protein HID58_033086 [Brassica napus]|uniref:Uncharacterized protein n=1 Tax=Brassica napus TaxID=3708 RepID=A0ABQ8BY84_BRANA|nr:hypothetical protein HID58_033086 [Brassica napus]
MEGNSIDDSEKANAVHTPTAMSKLQSSSGRVLRDLTNLPMKKDLGGSLKRSTSIPPPQDVPCKKKTNTSNVPATKRINNRNKVFTTNTKAGIEVVSTSGYNSNKRKRNLNAYSGTVKVNTRMDISRTTIPLASIFGRILGDLQNFSGSKVQNVYQSAAGHMSDRTYMHCENQLNTTKYPPSKRNKFYRDLRVNDQIAQRKTVLQSGTKQRNSVLRKDDARSTPKLMQTVVTGNNYSKVTYPSHVGYNIDDNSFPEVPSEGRDDQFYDLSSQESDKLVDNSEPVKCLYRDAVSEKANIESMMSRIRKICESKGKTKKTPNSQPIIKTIGESYNIMIFKELSITDIEHPCLYIV